MNKIIYWIMNDYYSHKLRFVVEIIIWVLFVFSALVVALTVPNPPMLHLYPLWILGCILSIWTSHNRKSFGAIFTYVILLGIDVTGLIRIIYNA